MAFCIDFPFGYFIFSLVSVLLTLFLFWYLWTVRNDSLVIRLGLAMIIAGAVGNLIDRLMLGEVIDFLDFMIGNFHWYVFNLADSYVTVGMVLILTDSVFLEKKREKSHT